MGIGGVRAGSLPGLGPVPGAARRRLARLGDLRRDLLDAAITDIASGGPSEVSLRGLARRLGVSHAAPAYHFPDKRALFTALAQAVADLLAAAL